MRAGQMMHLLTFQEATKTPDGIGGQTTAWTDAFQAMGKIESPRGLERVEAMKLTGKTQHNLYVYYDTNVNTELRIKWHDGYTERILNIDSVSDPNTRQRHMEIIAHEDTD